MHVDQDYRRLLFKLAAASEPAKKQGIKFRETLDTAALGTISASVGIVALILVLLNFTRGHVAGLEDKIWSVPKVTIAVIAGEGLGVVGLVLGRMRDGSISPLSAIGTIVCFLGQVVLAIYLPSIHLP